MAIHLDGRAPHHEIAAVFDEAVSCKTVEKRRQLMQRVPHLARVFTSLVAEFRASVPAFERKRELRDPSVQRDAKIWQPMKEAFTENGWTCGRACSHECCMGWTFEEWMNRHVTAEDDRRFAIISVLQHGGTNVVREMINNGLDLRDFNHLCGLHEEGLCLVSELGPIYLWVNQLLLCLNDNERVGTEYLDYSHSKLLRSQGTSNSLPRANAAEALQAALNDCSYYELGQLLKWHFFRSKIASAEGVTRTELLQFAKDLFQLIYRASHVCLYNEL